MTGRLHVPSEIRKRLFRRVASIAITTREGDVIGYLRTKLKDTNLKAMDTSLEVDSLRKIPEEISGTYVEETALRKLPRVIYYRCTSRFLLVSLDIFYGP